jgi:SAM-dependent methyltransferase
VTAATDGLSRAGGAAGRTAPVPGTTGRFSCVVDGQPRFHQEVLRWYACLTEVAKVRPEELVVHVVGGSASGPIQYLKDHGVAVHEVLPFDARSPHCNKISGALRLAEAPQPGVVVLCDTDVAVLEDPRSVVLPDRSVGGKLVDAPVPPHPALVDVFAAAGVALPPQVPLPWGSGECTVRGNNNGGLCLVPGSLLPAVASTWAAWAGWLLERLELLGQWAVHVDQVSMALALAEQHIGSHPLDVRWNMPTHDLTRIPPEAPTPAVLHYHRKVDPDGFIQMTGTRSIDRQIARANQAFDVVRNRMAPDDPAIPGDDHPDPRGAVTRLLSLIQPASILEFGLSGGDVIGDLRLDQYVGIERSADVLDRFGPTRPQGTLLVGLPEDHPGEVEVVLCLDELPAQAEPDAYRELVASLWRAARLCLVVSGLERPAPVGDERLHFHEPLTTTLDRVAPDAELYPLGDQGPSSTFAVLRPPAKPHPRDYTQATLAPLATRHPDPVSLFELRRHARRTTGFYPDHAPRLWEYPTVARLITEYLPTGSRVLDVGAGVTPLPPFLAHRGYVVDTVDPSSDIRSWESQPEWNEWGYLDYGSAGLAHRSWNGTVAGLPVRPPYDGIYSVSVIEHLPAAVRRALISDVATRTRPGGMVIFTIDLVRGGDALWNRNLGIQVEDPAVHGTMDDVVEEAAWDGLGLRHRETVRSWGDVDVDIGLLVLQRTAARTGTSGGRRRWGLRPLLRRLRLT